MNKYYNSRSIFRHLCNREMFGVDSNIMIKERLVKHLTINNLYSFEKHTSLSTMRISPTSQLLAVALTNNVSILDVQTKKIIASIEDNHDLITSIIWKKRNAEDLQRNCFFASSLDKSICYYRDFKRVAKIVEESGWLRCMAMSPMETTLIAGCFSDIICGYDPETLQKLWRIKDGHDHKEEEYELNSVVSLNFENCANNVFVSGTRYGSVRLWDNRIKPHTSIHKIETGEKINALEFSTNDTWLLCSNRNSTISLWDIRWLHSNENIKKPSLTNIKNFNKHKSNNYHIVSKFMNYDRNIITGSEDGNVYIYDVASGDVSKILRVSEDSVVHIVETNPDECNELMVITSILENKNIHFWSPNVGNAKDTPAESNENLAAYKARRNFHDSLLLKYSDKILKLLYKHNMSFGSNLYDLFNLIQLESDNHELLLMMYELLVDHLHNIEEDEEY